MSSIKREISERGRFAEKIRELEEKIEAGCLRESGQAAQLERLERERGELQATLHRVLSSRAWRLAERCRRPLRKMRRDLPIIEKAIDFLAANFVFRDRKRAASYDQSPPESGAALHSKMTRELPAGSRFPSSSEKSCATIAASQCGRSSDTAYQRWIDEQEPSSQELLHQREVGASFTLGPLFSIVMPVCQTDHAFLQACIESVLQQTYAKWHLCVAAVAGGDPRNVQFLRKLARQDQRIQLIELNENRGISNNSNAALDLATGEFIILLDHDDMLAPFALFELATRLQHQPGADILYSDHDYLDPKDNLRCAPLFKPDWSPEIMLSANYITHLTVLRRALIEEVGRFDSATDGAQDWDLFLRAVHRTSDIKHIPKILYHWRMHEGSTAHNDSAKSYAAAAQLLAIRRQMERCGMDAEPEVRPNGLLHARFQHTPQAMVSIIIPTKDRADLLSRCISTLREITRHRNFEILIVDNGSREATTKEYLRSLEEDERIRIIWYPGAFNYSAVNNRAAREARGGFLLFLNNDVEITRPDWLDELVAWANYDPVGIVGAKLLRPSGIIQHAGVILGMSGFADHPFADQPALTFGIAGSTGWYRDFLAVTGACMMMRRHIFDELGGFDEGFKLCGSDVEICLRAHERGYRVVYNPFAELIHHERQTRGAEIPPGDYERSFAHYKRWLIEGDPYWSPNLSLWNGKPDFRYRGETSSLEFAERHLESIKTALRSAPPNPRQPSLEDVLVSQLDCGEEQFRHLREQALAIRGFRAAKRVLWFIPGFENAFYGGIFTILRFAEYWTRERSVENLFAICDGVDRQTIAVRIRAVYPQLKDSDLFVVPTPEEAASLPPVDASICTFWKTCYFGLNHESAVRRFYMIQDFEPAFYHAGSITALVESTYRMGLYGIANTISLKKMYESEYGGQATAFTPCANGAVFYPPKIRRPSRNGPWQVFCYGRPDHPRNAFELLRAAMEQLKERMDDRVRIVSAGGTWNPSEHGVEGIIENLGVLDYEDTGRLYRQSDVGVVIMLTRHPSYIPLELMACGCLAVTNVNSWTSWLLQNGENCLLTHATARSIAETVERGLLDAELRERITGNALARVQLQYADWPAQMDKVYHYLCDPKVFMEDRQDIGGNQSAKESSCTIDAPNICNAQ